MVHDILHLALNNDDPALVAHHLHLYKAFLLERYRIQNNSRFLLFRTYVVVHQPLLNRLEYLLKHKQHRQLESIKNRI